MDSGGLRCDDVSLGKWFHCLKEHAIFILVVSDDLKEHVDSVLIGF